MNDAVGDPENDADGLLGVLVNERLNVNEIDSLTEDELDSEPDDELLEDDVVDGVELLETVWLIEGVTDNDGDAVSDEEGVPDFVIEARLLVKVSDAVKLSEKV